MRTTRTLSLRKEALTELTAGELSDVAGAQATVPCPYSLAPCLTPKISALFVNCPL
jgi:hypothetical protein